MSKVSVFEETFILPVELWKAFRSADRQSSERRNGKERKRIVHSISGTTTRDMQNCSGSLKNTLSFMTSSKACLNHPGKITALQFQKKNPVRPDLSPEWR